MAHGHANQMHRAWAAVRCHHALTARKLAMLWFSVKLIIIYYLAHNYFTLSIIMLSVSSISQKFASYCLTEPGK